MTARQKAVLRNWFDYAGKNESRFSLQSFSAFLPCNITALTLFAIAANSVLALSSAHAAPGANASAQARVTIVNEAVRFGESQPLSASSANGTAAEPGMQQAMQRKERDCSAAMQERFSNCELILVEMF